MTTKHTVLVAEVEKTNPAYTHIVLGRENHNGRWSYFTRAAGYMPDGPWIESSGHYDMPLVEALQDCITRLKRGY